MHPPRHCLNRGRGPIRPEFCPHGLTLQSPLFRALLLHRLRLPLPLTTARCSCRQPHYACGDHLAACPRSGVLRSRGGPLERAAACACAGRPGQLLQLMSWCVTSMLSPPGRTSGALTLWGGVQLAVDATLVSPLTAAGMPRCDRGITAGAASRCTAHRGCRELLAQPRLGLRPFRYLCRFLGILRRAGLLRHFLALCRGGCAGCASLLGLLLRLFISFLAPDTFLLFKRSLCLSPKSMARPAAGGVQKLLLSSDSFPVAEPGLLPPLQSALHLCHSLPTHFGGSPCAHLPLPVPS